MMEQEPTTDSVPHTGEPLPWINMSSRARESSTMEEWAGSTPQLPSQLHKGEKSRKPLSVQAKQSVEFHRHAALESLIHPSPHTHSPQSPPLSPAVSPFHAQTSRPRSRTFSPTGLQTEIIEERRESGTTDEDSPFPKCPSLESASSGSARDIKETEGSQRECPTTPRITVTESTEIVSAEALVTTYTEVEEIRVTGDERATGKNKVGVLLPAVQSYEASIGGPGESMLEEITMNQHLTDLRKIYEQAIHEESKAAGSFIMAKLELSRAEMDVLVAKSRADAARKRLDGCERVRKVCAENEAWIRGKLHGLEGELGV